MAHRAANPQRVAGPPATAAARRRGRWIAALGAAAGVVLAAGIAFRLDSVRNQRKDFGAPANEVISVQPLDAPPPTAPPLSPPPPMGFAVPVDLPPTDTYQPPAKPEQS